MQKICILPLILLISLTLVFLFAITPYALTDELTTDGKSVLKKDTWSILSQSSNDTLTFSIGLRKQSFFADEPIEIVSILKNETDQKLRLVEPYAGYDFVTFKVIQIEGDKPIPVQPVSCKAGPPDDYGYVFNPKESKQCVTNLLYDYDNGLPTGLYSLTCSYRVSSKIKVDWHGEIILPSIEFRIADPLTPLEKEARQIYLDVKKKAGNSRTVTSAMNSLPDMTEYEGIGVFARFSQYYEASAYWRTGDINEYKNKIMEYVGKYGNDDINSVDSLKTLGILYRGRKDYTTAKAMYSLLPDGYERIDGLRKCEAEMARQAESDNKP